MCAVPGWTESYQTRLFFLVRAYMSVGLMAFMSIRSRAKLPLPGWVYPVAILGVAASVGVKFTYDDQIRRFWNEIRGLREIPARMSVADVVTYGARARFLGCQAAAGVRERR